MCGKGGFHHPNEAIRIFNKSSKLRVCDKCTFIIRSTKVEGETFWVTDMPTFTEWP